MQVKWNPRRGPPEGATVECGVRQAGDNRAAEGASILNAAAIPEGFRALDLPRNPFIEADGPLHFSE